MLKQLCQNVVMIFQNLCLLSWIWSILMLHFVFESVYSRPHCSSEEESTPGRRAHQRTPMPTLQGKDCGSKCEHYITEHHNREASNRRKHATSWDREHLPKDTRARSAVVRRAFDAKKSRLREEHLNFASCFAGFISHDSICVDIMGLLGDVSIIR